MTQPTWTVETAYVAVCRCGRRCADHGSSEAAVMCARMHAADCSVALGTYDHDAAVDELITDVRSGMAP